MRLTACGQHGDLVQRKLRDINAPFAADGHTNLPHPPFPFTRQSEASRASAAAFQSRWSYWLRVNELELEQSEASRASDALAPRASSISLSLSPPTSRARHPGQ